MGNPSLPLTNNKAAGSFKKNPSSTNLNSNNNNHNKPNNSSKTSTNTQNTNKSLLPKQARTSITSQQILINDQPQPIPNCFSYSVKRPPTRQPSTNETKPKKASTTAKGADAMDEDPNATSHDSESLTEELTSSETSSSEAVQNKDSYKKPISNQNHRLPAIKFLISQATIEMFNDHKKIVNEIYRCHGKHMKKHIKFVTSKNNLIIIATDNQDVHELFSTPAEWPENAFAKGVKFLNKQKQETLQLIIKGVDTTTNLNDEEIIEELSAQGITNAQRITNKEGNPTTVVRLAAGDKRTYEKLLNGYVTIDLQRFRTSPSRTVLQCYNCQKVGHTKFNCPNEIRCLRCGGSHSHKECKNQVKCSNCGNEHTSCSRSCPYLREEAKQKQANQQEKSSTQTRKPSSTRLPSNPVTQVRQMTYAQAASGNNNQRQTPLVDNDIDKRLGDISNQIQVGSAKFVASLLTTSLDINQQNPLEEPRQKIPEHFTNLKNQLQIFIQNEISNFIQNQLDIFIAEMRLTIQNQFQQLTNLLNQRFGLSHPLPDIQEHGLLQQPILSQQFQQTTQISGTTEYVTGAPQQPFIRPPNRGKHMPGFNLNPNNNPENQASSTINHDE